MFFSFFILSKEQSFEAITDKHIQGYTLRDSISETRKTDWKTDKTGKTSTRRNEIKSFMHTPEDREEIK